MTARHAACLLLSLSFLLAACEDAVERSRQRASEHVRFLVGLTKSDVQEVRTGLPEGAKRLSDVFAEGSKPSQGSDRVRDALEMTRRQVQDLRVAKATFFALADSDGRVLGSNQDPDRMAGDELFEPYPGLKEAGGGEYVETTGAMGSAAGVRSRADGQWVAAHPVRAEGAVRGLYVAGWSWSGYAYRLEYALRSKVRSQLLEREGQDKDPLLYVFVVRGDGVFGAPEAPEVNMKAIARLGPLAKAADGPFDQALEITGREFGLAVQRAPALGDDVAIAVLRSET